MIPSPQPESTDVGHPVGSKIAAGLVGFFAGAGIFGSAYFAKGSDGLLPVGVSWAGTGVLFMCSAAVGAYAERNWKGAILTQILAMSPYIFLLMTAEPQTLAQRLGYPVLLWGLSALGIFVGNKVGELSDAA
jgi:hypothetical protein